MEQKALNEILEKHKLWLNSEDGGEQADLRSANLSSANLGSADLRSADLRSAHLRSADLRSADLRSANLRYADLRSANLRSADLRFADLRSADLSYAAGELKYIKSIFLEIYPITYTSDVLQIGCEKHAISDWWEFDDKRILEMDGKSALAFWRKWKDQIKTIIEMSPAEPIGFVAKESTEAA